METSTPIGAIGSGNRRKGDIVRRTGSTFLSEADLACIGFGSFMFAFTVASHLVVREQRPTSTDFVEM